MGVLPFESLVAQGRRRGPPRCLKVSRDNPAEYSLSSLGRVEARRGARTFGVTALRFAAGYRAGAMTVACESRRLGP
jgi:hypothetical protein